MATINRPIFILPATKTVNKKLHTIHLDSTIFTVQRNGTSVLSFRNKSDAIHFGKMLETHYELTHEWPIVDFEQTVLYKYTTKANRFKYLYMKNWEEDDLRDFCIKNSLGMLDIFKFEDDMRLVGNAFIWEAPMNFYINDLNNRLDEE